MQPGDHLLSEPCVSLPHPGQLVDVRLQLELLVCPAARDGRLDQTLVVVQRLRQLTTTPLQGLKVAKMSSIDHNKYRVTRQK